MLSFPEIAPGGAGALPGTTDRVWAIDVPHAEVAVTEIVTEPVIGPGVATIELDVENPLHPEGSVQE
jgi:hypothetical protein